MGTSWYAPLKRVALATLHSQLSTLYARRGRNGLACFIAPRPRLARV